MGTNMIAGVELIRRKDRRQAYAMTCTLLTNSEGKKMGKTAKGALWLDPKRQHLTNFTNIGEILMTKMLKIV